MRLLILQGGFGTGGAEKVVAMLAAHRATAGDEVHVAAVGAQNPDTYFAYPPGVRLHPLAGTGGRTGQIARLRAIRRLLRALRPDLAVAFLTKVNTLTLAASIGLGLPVIVSERNNPSRQAAHPLWRPAQGMLMHRAAGIVMQTDRARRDLPQALWSRAHVIANPCEPLTGFAPGASGAPLRMVAVGRLDPQKGFDLLIEAFARMQTSRPVSLQIFGEGPERARLEALRDRLGLASRVALPGASAAPGGWIAEADLLVAPSRFEGFPNVVAEAVVTGLPVIAFDCDYGPRELIRDGGNGLLVPVEDIDGLARAMTRLAEDESLRMRMTASADMARAALRPARILAEWDALFAGVMRHRGMQGHAPAVSSASSS